MKYLSQFLIIMGFTLTGEALQRLIPPSGAVSSVSLVVSGLLTAILFPVLTGFL